MEVHIDERKEKILELLSREGKVRVGDLSQMFNLSEATIRMDLTELEQKGLLCRVHGGAVSSYKTYYNMSLQQRLSANRPQKQAIAAKALEMISDRDTIMLNSGTTTLTLVRMLPPRMNLSIVTNSVAIALEAGGNPNFNVVLLGGAINSTYQFIYGDDANAQIEKYHADKLILSVDGITPDDGLTTYYDREAELDRLMLARCATKIIVADSTKIGRTAFARIAEVNQVDYLITNKDASVEEEIAELSEIVPDIVTV